MVVIFSATEDHPFWTPEGWKSANKTMTNDDCCHGYLNVGILEVGDFIFGADDKKIEVKSLEYKEVDPETDLYNFTLDGNSTYIGNGFVMHNKGDPLAQTFIVDQEGGCFVTKIDLFFQAKDENLPVRVEIREVINGYPGPRVLPFGRKVLEPSDVNLSDNATTATTFTFDSPDIS